MAESEALKSHGRQCYLKACWKSKVFNLDLKVDTVGAVRTSNGRQFQMDGTACRKARAPIFSLC